VGLEEGRQHLPRHQERDRPREEAEQQQQSAECLQNPGESHLRPERDGTAGRWPDAAEQAEQLLYPVLHVEKGDADAKQRVRDRAEPGENGRWAGPRSLARNGCHGRSLPELVLERV
jgi:hypothetical protein